VLVNRRDTNRARTWGVPRESDLLERVCVRVPYNGAKQQQLTDAHMHSHKVKPTCASIRVCVGCVLCFQSEWICSAKELPACMHMRLCYAVSELVASPWPNIVMFVLNSVNTMPGETQCTVGTLIAAAADDAHFTPNNGSVISARVVVLHPSQRRPLLLVLAPQ
jgi:hypothetical protein